MEKKFLAVLVGVLFCLPLFFCLSCDDGGSPFFFHLLKWGLSFEQGNMNCPWWPFDRALGFNILSWDYNEYGDIIVEAQVVVNGQLFWGNVGAEKNVPLGERTAYYEDNGGQIVIKGDHTNWKPTPMVAWNDDWFITPDTFKVGLNHFHRLQAVLMYEGIEWGWLNIHDYSWYYCEYPEEAAGFMIILDGDWFKVVPHCPSP